VPGAISSHFPLAPPTQPLSLFLLTLASRVDRCDSNTATSPSLPCFPSLLTPIVVIPLSSLLHLCVSCSPSFSVPLSFHSPFFFSSCSQGDHYVLLQSLQDFLMEARALDDVNCLGFPFIFNCRMLSYWGQSLHLLI